MPIPPPISGRGMPFRIPCHSTSWEEQITSGKLDFTEKWQRPQLAAGPKCPYPKLKMEFESSPFQDICKLSDEQHQVQTLPSKNTMRKFAWKSSGASYLATTTVSDRDAIMERCSILFTSCPSTAAASAFARIVKMFALGIAVIMVLDQHCTKIMISLARMSQVQSDDKSFNFPDARVRLRLRRILHSLSYKALTRNSLMFCIGSRLHLVRLFFKVKLVSCPFFHLHGFLTSAEFFFMLFHHPQPPHQPFQHPSRSATLLWNWP